MAEQPRPQFDVDFLAGFGKQPGAQPTEGDFPQADRDQAESQDLQGGQGAAPPMPSRSPAA